MKDMFSAGELAKFQNISKQTLLYYDKIDLFKPSYVDPQTDYRYYSAEQLDYLDTILIMKKIGFSLKEIKKNMECFTTQDSIVSFRQQLAVIENRIQELSLIQSRLKHRCEQVEQAFEQKNRGVAVELTDEFYILCHEVESPYSMKEISLATKKCYTQALADNLPVFFQCGVSVPLKKIREGRCIEAKTAFLTTENVPSVENIVSVPKGLTASLCHFGSYESITESYIKLIEYCTGHGLRIISDSYEFCINDYITSKFENEFITKIMFYVEKI